MEKQTIGNATLYCGDVLEILPQLDPGFDAVITDPPYSSGGLYKGQRARPPSTKYSNSANYQDFSGDNRDQRSWTFWCSQWLSQCSRIVKPGGYAMIFTDWRQLPALSDAFQGGGFLWRGIVAWDKTASARAPHTGYFRHQAEYVLWGSNGALPGCPHGGPFPGVVTERVNPKEKMHMTAKPLKVMEALIQPVPPAGNVIDPFMGSASTAIPVLQRGGKFTGIELSREYFDIACGRIEQLNSRKQEHRD